MGILIKAPARRREGPLPQVRNVTESGDPADALHIREVVRITGLRREQLYMWQRRYGFPAPLRDRTDLAFDDVVASLRAEAGDALSFRACSWFSTYRIHHRAASRFRERRCFLLGDAAPGLVGFFLVRVP